MTVRIVTDSTADLPRELAESLGVSVVPLTVTFGHETFLDGVTMSSDEFYRRLASTKDFPTTSQPPVGAFVERFRTLGSNGDSVVSIHISASLSGTYNVALQAKEELKDTGLKIAVVDSRQVSIGLGFAVLAAARAAADGNGLESVAETARQVAARTHIVFMLRTLEFLRRGGRIGRASAFLGSLLKIYPILEVQGGVVTPLERPRSRKRGLDRMCEIAEGRAPFEELAVLAGADADGANYVFERIGKLAPSGTDLVVSQIGPVVGAHAGPGLVGFAYVNPAGTRK